jgi:hypothetical protein
MITNVKVVSEVGYILVDVLRFWHSTVDCASFGLLPKVSLLVIVCAGSLLAAGLGDKRVALVVEVGVVAKMLEVGLPKQQKLQDGYPHTLECMVSGTKQYA